MNNVTLIGRLTRDPELRYVQGSGNAVAQFTLAVDKRLSKEKRQQFEAQGKPTADFIRVVVWGRQAENCNNYLAKGRLVAIQGSINTSTYQNQNGETRYSTDVVANNVQFLEWGDKPAQNNQGGARPYNNGGGYSNQGGGYNNQAQNAPQNSGFNNDFANDFLSIEDDDDIPF